MAKFYWIKGLAISIKCINVGSDNSVMASLPLFAKPNRLIVANKLMRKGVLLKNAPDLRNAADR